MATSASSSTSTASLRIYSSVYKWNTTVYKESFQEVLPTRNIGHTPFHAPSGNSTPLANCMNDVLLPTVAAPLANSNDEQQDSESSSDDSSDTSSDSDEIQTLTDDSDDETTSNIQKINLLFSVLEDVNYDTSDEDKM